MHLHVPVSPQIHELLDLLLNYGVSLMQAGAHTSRVQRNVVRIAEAFGYQAAITLFQRTVMISVFKQEDCTVNHTLLRKMDYHPAINFATISDLSTLSWQAGDDGLTIGEINSRYREIVGRKRASRWVILLSVAVANAAFCRLFEGDVWAMGLVFAATLCSFFLRQELGHRHVNHLLSTIVCAFVASLIASMGFVWGVGATPSTAVAVSVLFLIPGVHLINAVSDLLQGYTLIGLSRAVNAFNLILCITTGLSITLFLMGVKVI